jgi:transcriptional regulator with XRE-family HTH domain
MSPNMHPETPLCLCRMTCIVRSNGIHRESEVAKTSKESDRQATYRLVAELGSEKYVIERLRDEMKARGWSQAELSRRMVESTGRSGGVLAQGVLSKMLRGGQDGRGRHVSIEQLITLSKVFSVPLNELLVPASTLANIRGWRYLMEAGELQNEIRHLRTDYKERVIDVGRMLRESPELLGRVREYADALRAKEMGMALDLWRQDRGTEPTEEELAADVHENRTPALVTVEDALEEGERDE